MPISDLRHLRRTHGRQHDHRHRHLRRVEDRHLRHPLRQEHHRRLRLRAGRHRDQRAETAASETFSVTASDPLSSIDTKTLTINVSAVNDNPVLTTPTTGAAYTEQLTALDISGAITVTDADTGATAQRATVTLASPVSGDVLAVTTPGPYTAAYNASTGVLTLTGGGTLAQMQTALRSLTFSSTSDDPTLEGTRTGRRSAPRSMTATAPTTSATRSPAASPSRRSTAVGR